MALSCLEVRLGLSADIRCHFPPRDGSHRQPVAQILFLQNRLAFQRDSSGDRQSADGKEDPKMRTFTIDEQNGITVFATKEEAASGSPLQQPEGTV
jgi:hypothetical protein